MSTSFLVNIFAKNEWMHNCSIESICVLFLWEISDRLGNMPKFNRSQLNIHLLITCGDLNWLEKCYVTCHLWVFMSTVFLNFRMDYIFVCLFLINFHFLCFSCCFLSFPCSIFTLLSLASFWSKRLNEAKSFQILHFSTNKLYGLPLVQFIHSWIMVKSLSNLYLERGLL